MNFLTPIPLLYRWLAFAAAALALLGFGYVRGVQHEERIDTQRQAKEQEQQLRAQIAVAAALRTEEHRKQDAVKGIADELQQQLVAARAAADSNRAAGQRLRDQLASACLAGRAQPAAASAGSPADAAGRVLADVQRRLAEAEDATVEFADASRRAGLGCERAYETLNPKE